MYLNLYITFKTFLLPYKILGWLKAWCREVAQALWQPDGWGSNGGVTAKYVHLYDSC